MMFFSARLTAFALAALVSAVSLEAAARTWTITGWSGNSVKPKENRFTEAVNRASDGDILELQNDVTVNANVVIRKRITVKSKDGNHFSIFNEGVSFGTTINAGATLIMTNVTYDCHDMRQIKDVFNLAAQQVVGGVTNVARMILMNGATIQNAYLSSNTRNENAVIHIKTGAVFTMNPGSAILNCRNESQPGKGGAICCDYGTVIMTGGTIANCTAKGAGGAIHTDGTRVDSVDNYGINARGDIYISGGYITNNTCGAGFFGGGIYLGNSGPVLHITGTAVISNNHSGVVSDDVSTFNLENAWANRLKLVDYHDSHPAGFTYAGQLFTGWVGVRYPDVSQTVDPEHKRFGAVWEYFNGQQEEARQFFWNGNNEYRGKIDANSLVWSKHVIHELPRDGEKVADLMLKEESPIYMELSEDYKMEKPANVPENMELVIDLKGFDLECDFHVSNTTSRVRIFDSSTNKTGTVTGHRDSEYPNAFLLEGGSYHTLPKPEWVASNCVVVGNYCTNHPYMVAIKVWDAKHERVVTDLTKVKLEDADSEVREVAMNADGSFDVGKITFSSGDWEFMQYTNANYRVQVLAAPAVQGGEGDFEESGPRIKLFDTHESVDIAPWVEGRSEGDEPGSGNYGREDEFVWDPTASGLIKLIHLTMREVGEGYETNDTHTAYFRFPPACFTATQRKDGSKLPIAVVDSLLTALGFNRADNFNNERVNDRLDGYEPNGLRKWENIVTGTDENQLLLSTAAEDGDGLVLDIELVDADKRGRTDTGYTVKYALCKSTDSGWERIGEVKDDPDFSISLLSEDGKSAGASGFYRVTTLIIPNGNLSVTNALASTNIVGVLEVKSKLANTLAAVPWVSLAADPVNAGAVRVADYVHTAHLTNNDAVQVADKGIIYRMWNWNETGKTWDEAITVTSEGASPAPKASEHQLARNSAAWVTRSNPAERPFFLIGQYSSEEQTLTIKAGSAKNSVCTLVPNPSLEDVAINNYAWNGNPHKDDLIRIPNGGGGQILLQWENGAWGRWVYNPETYLSEWRTDQKVPAGTGFFYQRCGETSFELTLPASVPAGE